MSAMQNPIYRPKGRAAEYGEYALNIYTGCCHGCLYCYAPLVLRKSRAGFHTHAEPREGIAEAARRQLARGRIPPGATIHLCFSCDPYPAGADTSATRECIRAIKAAGCSVQILTKGGMRAARDFDLLGVGDWFGATIAAGDYDAARIEPGAAPPWQRLWSLEEAHKAGIRTWVSFEPVIDPGYVIRLVSSPDLAFVDKIAAGKLNYCAPGAYWPPADWGAFARELERLCAASGRECNVKGGLRRAIEQGGADG